MVVSIFMFLCFVPCVFLFHKNVMLCVSFPQHQFWPLPKPGNHPLLPRLLKQPHLLRLLEQPHLPRLLEQPHLPRLLEQPLLPRLMEQPLFPRLLKQLHLLQQGLSQSAIVHITMTDEATMTPSLFCSNLQPTRSEGAIIPTATVPVSSTQPTNNPSTDGTTTTSVIIVVAVVIILVVIVVGVIILVVIFKAKKRKQKLVISKLQSVTTENEDVEMIMKQERTTEKETNSSTYQSPYAEIRTKAPPQVPTKSEELIEYLNLKSTVTGGYGEIELERADTKHALLAKPPRHVNISDPHLKRFSPVLCTRILTNTRVPQMYKKLTSIMCQTPHTHTQLRSQVKSLRQCIVSQSSLHSLQMQLELLTLKIFSLMARYTCTPSPLNCQSVRKCY